MSASHPPSTPPSTTILATWKEPGEVAVNTAWEARLAGADLLTTIEKGLIATELDPEFIAIGLGSLPNAEGVIELDASIMDGATLEAGAVCAVKDIVPIISVARMVMEKTPHVMLAGDEARQFALDHGFKPQDLMRPVAQGHYEEWKATHKPDDGPAPYVHAISDIDGQHAGDTVTMLGLELVGEHPHLVAASSTSGLAYKLPGRVGDSPIVGAGIYADDAIGAAGATGLGEELWKAVASFRTVEAMGRGLSPQAACEETVRFMLRRQPKAATIPCVVLALAKNGDFGASTTTGEFHLWACKDGAVSVHVYGPPTS
jgi:isoaspartyl peptidase/L-asparaginase-like protein (Ntn-hydrolase superfamily)